jgi:hypothetical protein
VVPQRAATAAVVRGPHLLVSAGGGIVGQSLFRCVLQARALMRQPLPLRLIAGPFLPEPDWADLHALAAGQPGVELVRHVSDMVSEMRRARASLSQWLQRARPGGRAGAGGALRDPPKRTRNRAERLAALGARRCCLRPN